MTETYHPLVKRLLDGELSRKGLPTELRAQGAEALRLLGVVDRAPVSLPARLDARVMDEVRRRAHSPLRRAWRRLVDPRDVELRLRVRPWVVVGGALAAAAAPAPLVARPAAPPPRGRAVLPASRGNGFLPVHPYAPRPRQVSRARDVQ